MRFDPACVFIIIACFDNAEHTGQATFVPDLQLNLDANIQSDVIFLDFAKAFDKTLHARLGLKLSKLNLDPSVVS